MHQHRHNGGQAVVIAVDDFFHRHGVILIDDGDNAPLKQFFEGSAQVMVAFLVLHILLGNQQLTYLVAVFSEHFIVHEH